MTLPAAGYLSNATRTVAEMKTALEDVRDFIADMPGGVARNTLTIAAGTITPGDGTSGGCHQVDTEAAAATDDLSNIAQTNTPDGRMLYLYSVSTARVVTIKHNAGGTGQITLTDSADFVLDALDKWVLVQRRGSDWVEIQRGYGIDYPGVHDYARIAAVPANNILCPHSRLRIDYATAATLTIAADTVVLADSAGRFKEFNSLSETLTISSTGANGRDVVDNGGAEQASVWYHLFAIGKTDGTLDVFASQVGFPGSGTSIYTRLPAGYTFAGYLGAVYNNASSNLIASSQRGNNVARTIVGVLSGGTSASLATVSLSAAVPITATVANGTAYCISTSGSGAGNWEMYSDTSANSMGGHYFYNIATSTGNGLGGDTWSMVMTTAQSLAYIKSGGSISVSIFVNGWEF